MSLLVAAGGESGGTIAIPRVSLGEARTGGSVQESVTVTQAKPGCSVLVEAALLSVA